MPALLKADLLISVEDYLVGEVISEVRHEYVGGEVYAMAGASNVHNIIAGNVFAALHYHLDGSPCVPYVSDSGGRRDGYRTSSLIQQAHWRSTA